MEVFGDFLCPHVCNKLGHITRKGEEREGVLVSVFPSSGQGVEWGIKEKENDSTPMMSVLNEIKIICLAVAAVIF